MQEGELSSHTDRRLKHCSRDPQKHHPEWGRGATVSPSLEENCQVDRRYWGVRLSVRGTSGKLFTSFSKPQFPHL